MELYRAKLWLSINSDIDCDTRGKGWATLGDNQQQPIRFSRQKTNLCPGNGEGNSAFERCDECLPWVRFFADKEVPKLWRKRGQTHSDGLFPFNMWKGSNGRGRCGAPWKRLRPPWLCSAVLVGLLLLLPLRKFSLPFHAPVESEDVRQDTAGDGLN